MVPAKLLVGGTVAVGSTATAVVVANKYGLFNTSTSLKGNQNTEASAGDKADNDPNVAGSGVEDAPRAETVDGENDLSTIVPNSDGEPATSQAKTKQQEIKESIKTIGANIEIKIKAGTPGKETPLDDEQDNNLEGLKGYLTDQIKNELTHLVSGGHKTLIFTKNENTWTYLVKKEHIEAWVKENWGNSAKLSITSGNATDLDTLQTEDLKKLFEALKKNKELFVRLKSESEEKTIAFKKVNDNFELSHNQVAIEAWVKSTSNGKATLKAWEGETEKALSAIENELEKLFESISSDTNKDLFKKDGKNIVIVFEKDKNDWKHIKQAIKDWLGSQDGGNSKFTISIKNTKETDLDSTDDNNLTGLLNYLEKDKKDLLKFPTNNSTALIFKKTNNNWNIVHSKDTITNWISSTSNNKATLKLQDGNEEKDLDSMKNGKPPGFNKLFKAIKKKETELSALSSQTTVAFEKVGEEWKHIKEAIKNLFSTNSWNTSHVKIKKDDQPETTIDNAKDDDLIGLLNHLKSKISDYSADLKQTSTNVTFEKTGSNWSKKSQ